MGPMTLRGGSSGAYNVAARVTGWEVERLVRTAARKAAGRACGKHFNIKSLKILNKNGMAREVISKVSRYDGKTVGMEAARTSLHHTIAAEEEIYSLVSRLCTGVEMPATVDREEAINTMLALDFAAIIQMNLGGLCWYFSRVWGLMCLANLEKYKRKFLKRVSICNNGALSDFVGWMTGPDYSREDLLAQIEQPPHDLLPRPLACIVYDYLAAPPAHLLRQEILRLI